MAKATPNNRQGGQQSAPPRHSVILMVPKLPGKVRVTVLDHTGAFVSNAPVTLMVNGNPLPTIYRTDNDGSVEIEVPVPPNARELTLQAMVPLPGNPSSPSNTYQVTIPTAAPAPTSFVIYRESVKQGPGRFLVYVLVKNTTTKQAVAAKLVAMPKGPVRVDGILHDGRREFYIDVPVTGKVLRIEVQNPGRLEIDLIVEGTDCHYEIIAYGATPEPIPVDVPRWEHWLVRLCAGWK